MEKELAQKVIAALKAIPGSRHWSFVLDFDQMDEKDEIRLTYKTGLFMGNECFIGSGKTVEEAIGSLILRIQERPILKAVSA